MPSKRHQGLLQLFRNRPMLAAELVLLSGQESLPAHDSVRLADAGASPVTLPEYGADTTVVLWEGGDPVYVIVVEVQLACDPDKRFSWPYYGAAQRCRYRCPCCVLVLAPDPQVARWAATPIDLGQPGSPFVPLVVVPSSLPRVDEPAEAARRPELAVLSALGHGRREDGLAVVQAALLAVGSLDDDRKTLYYDLVLDAASETTRRLLEALMRPDGYEYQSEFARKYFGEGLAQGKAEGKAEGKVEGLAQGKALSLLAVLESRGLPVTEGERQRMLGCRDQETLDRWLLHAVSIHAVGELFH